MQLMLNVTYLKTVLIFLVGNHYLFIIQHFETRRHSTGIKTIKPFFSGTFAFFQENISKPISFIVQQALCMISVCALEILKHEFKYYFVATFFITAFYTVQYLESASISFW